MFTVGIQRTMQGICFSFCATSIRGIAPGTELSLKWSSEGILFRVNVYEAQWLAVVASGPTRKHAPKYLVRLFFYNPTYPTASLAPEWRPYHNAIVVVDHLQVSRHWNSLGQNRPTGPHKKRLADARSPFSAHPELSRVAEFHDLYWYVIGANWAGSLSQFVLKVQEKRRGLSASRQH